MKYKIGDYVEFEDNNPWTSNEKYYGKITEFDNIGKTEMCWILPESKFSEDNKNYHFRDLTYIKEKNIIKKISKTTYVATQL